MSEIWKSVKGYEKIIEVSNLGNVRTLDRNIETECNNQFGKSGTKRIRIIKGQLCTLKLKKNGYFQAAVRTPGKRKWFLVHRLVAEAFLSNPQNLKQVNHKDGNKQNNEETNLEWTNASDNQNHAVQLSLTKNQEQHYKAKLTVLDVKEIRKSKDSSRVLGLKYKVHRSTIKAIRKYKTWKYV